MTPSGANDLMDLVDWKRRVFDMYARVRRSGNPREAWETWRRERDDLFRSHPQSPLPEEERGSFPGITYYPYDPRSRVLADVVEAAPERYDIATSGEEGGSYAFSRFGVARFELDGAPLELELYWLEGYGGGVFMPYRDATSGRETYGAGRYLLDTVKGADLGSEGARLVLDFNFSFNPSCSYDPRWVCPLAPPPNRLAIAVMAGERVK